MLSVFHALLYGVTSLHWFLQHLFMHSSSEVSHYNQAEVRTLVHFLFQPFSWRFAAQLGIIGPLHDLLLASV